MKIDQLNADQAAPASAAVAVDISAADHTFTDPQIPTRIYVGGTGDVKVDAAGGGTVTFKAVPVGTTLQVAVTKIYRTGTTATLMVALFNQPL